jgi:hypothetical protein
VSALSGVSGLMGRVRGLRPVTVAVAIVGVVSDGNVREVEQ